eukprot:Blabericola_migrator_1__7457@NODE_3805_length_1497_cov_27_739860_g2359_i0_p1_GENE_NODE_3805_length_1497_cov_27_739860_g2359_i0NODE_3805_length_1497_cov_27_739860_g2359_i0_p1_ORF_typecomplete_len247_score57_95HC2/PF07382_11/5_2e10SMC_N/PF02463_19/0_00034DUF572/PF04502_13/0_0013AspBHydro_N/PF05279_11/0_0095CDC27/PF09507_10/0_059SRPalpha_N/PF04086_13/0_34Borrelia_P83/PF05262_11/0_67MAJIN/PF15077_6/1DUF2944/PF11161_8/1_4DUF4407/PF14362_6/1_5GAGA_bind/PF06217_12/3Peptidase_S46/PF10459_9/5_5U79_P34/PF
MEIAIMSVPGKTANITWAAFSQKLADRWIQEIMKRVPADIVISESDPLWLEKKAEITQLHAEELAAIEAEFEARHKELDAAEKAAAAQRRTAEKAAAEKAAAEKARAEKAKADKKAAEKAAADRRSSEKAAALRAKAEKKAAEEATADRQSTKAAKPERLAANKAAAVEVEPSDGECRPLSPASPSNDLQPLVEPIPVPLPVTTTVPPSLLRAMRRRRISSAHVPRKMPKMQDDFVVDPDLFGVNL